MIFIRISDAAEMIHNFPFLSVFSGLPTFRIFPISVITTLKGKRMLYNDDIILIKYLVGKELDNVGLN